MNQFPYRPQQRSPWQRPEVAGAVLAIWFAWLCFVPDPRPLSAPDRVVSAIQSLTGRSEPIARVAASIALRGLAFALLGLLLTATIALVLPARVAIPLGLLGAPLLTLLSQWINFGYFPVTSQLKFSVPAAIFGALAALAFRRRGVALAGLAVLVMALYFWAMPSRVGMDLETAARLTAQHILAHNEEIRDGDEGFADATRIGFAFAEDNSHHTDPVQANRALILALGVVLGDEKIARIARREVDSGWEARFAPLRQRITLYGRGDLPRHYWVSAGLVVLTNESNANTVGLGKEVMDSQPGGSGFSFVDMGANRAGILMAAAATRNPASARAMQIRVLEHGRTGPDFCPEVLDLPEGLTRDQFQNQFGGLGGPRTREILATIDQRINALRVMQLP